MNAKRKTTRTITTALAALALLAAHGIAGNGASAQGFFDQIDFTEGLEEAIKALEENAPTDADCLAAWESSWAYGQCGTRSIYTLVEETIKALGLGCSVETHCEHWSENPNDQRGGGRTPASRRATWEGQVEVLPNIQNCNGTLKRIC